MGGWVGGCPRGQEGAGLPREYTAGEGRGRKESTTGCVSGMLPAAPVPTPIGAVASPGRCLQGAPSLPQAALASGLLGL